MNESLTPDWHVIKHRRWKQVDETKPCIYLISSGRSSLFSPTLFPAVCGSPSDTWGHRAASVHSLDGARTADIKTLLMFLSGNLQTCTNIITHVGTNDVCIHRPGIIRCSIIGMFHNAVKTCERSIFYAETKCGREEYWRFVFCFTTPDVTSTIKKKKKHKGEQGTFLQNTNSKLTELWQLSLTAFVKITSEDPHLMNQSLLP